MGVSEHRGKNRKIESNYLQLQHPDFSILSKNGKTEALPSITLTNSSNGVKPLEMHLGVFRIVCSNGAISKDTIEEYSIKHNEMNLLNLANFVNNINNKSQIMLDEINKLKQRNLSPKEMSAFAYEAAKLRFSKEQLVEINPNDFLKINREEDKGDDAWTIFNRIQESLTHDITNLREDITLNKKLFSLTEQFMLN
jgi:uncharacterized protein YfkK (UPF0435 family)